MTDILTANGLAKRFPGNGSPVLALRGIDLAIGPGEFVAFMGPSGCGKSTMLHLLGGLDTPTEGEIHLAGERIDTLSEARRAILRRRHVGIVFQAYNLLDNMTVQDNVELPALLAGYSPREARLRRSALLEQLGIADKARATPSSLSGGEKQRVALARALINTPSVLLADEPTGNLDSGSSGEVVALLHQCNEQGQAILLVTHDHVVASAATRICHMRDGKIRDETRVRRKGDAEFVLSRLIDLQAN